MKTIVIGPKEQAAIEAAMAIAKAKPIPLATLQRIAVPNDGRQMLTLEEKKQMGFDEERPLSQQVMIGTYRMAVSYEEQPVGLLLHVSLSDEAAEIGMVPSIAVVSFLLAFIDVSLLDSLHMWIEEYKRDGKPGGMAVNLLFDARPKP